MPEHQKEKKSGNTMQETKAEGGAEIFMPTKKKRSHKIRYPKGVDPKNPPPQGPDPERWLPKWQRSRFKKLAKKRGIYLRGAQGDAQIDTDVMNMQKTTVHQEAVEGPSKRRRKR